MLIRAPLAAILLAAASPADSAPLEPVAIGEGVYAFLGEPGEPAVANGGNVSNSGFIVGANGIVVVDTGASYRHGLAMLEAIAQVSGKPVKLVIITHAAPEFLFGSAAFTERGAALLAHAKSAELMARRCATCLENLTRVLGPEMMAGSRLVVPERTLADSTAISTGGHELELLYFGWAATPGDLAIFDRTSGVLFAGALVWNQRVPEMRDGRIASWLSALQRLEALPIHTLVPGHGPLGGVETIARTRAYLRDLDARVRELYRSGASLPETLDLSDLPEYRDWDMYPAQHRRNAQQRYLELEVEELGSESEQ